MTEPFEIPEGAIPRIFPSLSSGSYSPPDWYNIPSIDSLEIVETQYDPENENNHFPISRPSDPEAAPRGKKRSPSVVAREKLQYEHTAFKVTEKLRKQASKANPVTSIAQLRKMVR